MKGLDRAIDLDPKLRSALLNRGRLQLELGNLGKAEQDLLDALALQADAQASHLLGRVSHEKEAFRRAANLYRQALLLCKDEALRGEIEADLDRALKAIKEKP